MQGWPIFKNKLQKHDVLKIFRRTVLRKFRKKIFSKWEVQPNSIIPVKCEDDVNEISKYVF